MVDALRSLLSSQSADGGVVTEAVQLLADLVKARSCVCPPEVVAVLASVHTADITSAKDFQGGEAGGVVWGGWGRGPWGHMRMSTGEDEC